MAIGKATVLLFIAAVLSQMHAPDKKNRIEVHPIPSQQSFALAISRLDLSVDGTSSASIELGKLLFEEPLLSADTSVSCASCHMPQYWFAEPRRVSHGLGKHSRRRNTPSLVDVAMIERSFDWDGRAQSLAHQLEGVFSTDGDMAQTLGTAAARLRSHPIYHDMFTEVFGRSPDRELLIDALVAFQESLASEPSRVDKYFLMGDSTALNASEIRGWRLFRSNRAGCSGCHISTPDPNGTDRLFLGEDRFHNLGVGYEAGVMTDAGRYDVTRRWLDWGRFRAVSLRNVSKTSPYMHDGSIETLEEVVEFYASGGRENRNLDVIISPRSFTQEEKDDLVAILKAFSSELSSSDCSQTIGCSP